VRPELAGDDGLEYCIALIDERRGELEGEAFSSGARLFAERPKAFTRRMGSYWKLWVRERAEA
jgi:hypothetical protein